MDLVKTKERFKIRPENFATKADMLCYLMALQIVATDEDFIMPFTGKPEFEPARDALGIAARTVEILQKEFHAVIPDFDPKVNVYYQLISEKEVLRRVYKEKLPVMMFDRVNMEISLKRAGADRKTVGELKEGIVVYFPNMKKHLKGYKKFEDDVRTIIEKAFLYDITFLNPLMPEKNYSEYCDIFIDFFNDCVICQCKEYSRKDPSRLIKRTIVNGLNQLRASVNKAKAKKVKLFMVNSIRKFNDYNFADIKNIYPILIVNKKPPFFDFGALKKEYPELNKLTFMPIILSTDELNFLVQELDTPSDLFAYFKKREVVVRQSKLAFKDEIELLSYYLLNLKSFEPVIVGTRYSVLVGFYEEYKKGRASKWFTKKKELDKVSYWVDEFIKGSYTSGELNYLKGIEYVLKLNRIQRRRLAQKAEEKRSLAIVGKRDRWGLIIFGEMPDVAFVVYFTPKFGDLTQSWLYLLGTSAQYKTDVKRVVCLAETTQNKRHLRAGFYFEKVDDYTAEEEELIKKQCDGIWGNGIRDKYGEFDS